MNDKLSTRHADLLSGIYDCVDRIVFNACFQFGQASAGFRLWWRQWGDQNDVLHNNIDTYMGEAHKIGAEPTSPFA